MMQQLAGRFLSQSTRPSHSFCLFSIRHNVIACKDIIAGTVTRLSGLPLNCPYDLQQPACPAVQLDRYSSCSPCSNPVKLGSRFSFHCLTQLTFASSHTYQSPEVCRCACALVHPDSIRCPTHTLLSVHTPILFEFDHHEMMLAHVQRDYLSCFCDQ